MRPQKTLQTGLNSCTFLFPFALCLFFFFLFSLIFRLSSIIVLCFYSFLYSLPRQVRPYPYKLPSKGTGTLVTSPIIGLTKVKSSSSACQEYLALTTILTNPVSGPPFLAPNLHCCKLILNPGFPFHLQSIMFPAGP